MPAVPVALGRDTAVDAVVALAGNGSRVLAQDTVPFALWCAYHYIGGAIPVDWRRRREPLATMLRLSTGP